MARRRARDLTVGLVFALALVILALTVMTVGSESSLFAQKAYFRVVFPNTTGLVPGSPVKMSGVQVGTVAEIRLSTDPGTTGIEVKVGVDRTYASRVRQDSRAALRVLQLLSGEKFVEISPGSPGQPELPRGAVIEPSQDPEIMAQAAAAAENINAITVSLSHILSKLESGETLLGQMINDPQFGRAGLEDLALTLKNVQRLTDGLAEGRGVLGRLLQDEQLADGINDLTLALAQISDLIASIDVEHGAIGALLEEGGAGEQAILDLREAAASLKSLGTCLGSRDGLVGRLLCDAEYSEALANDLRATLSNLAEITDKINRGEGTLGALVNERTLHDSLETVATGVDDSKFARWLFRHYQKQGIEVETREAEKQENAEEDR